MGEVLLGLLTSSSFWLMLIIAGIVAVTAYYLQQQAYQIAKLAQAIEKSSQAQSSQADSMSTMTESINKQAHYLTAKSNILSEMSGTISSQSAYLTAESATLKEIAGAVKAQAEFLQLESDEIARKDFGVEIVSVETPHLEDYDSQSARTEIAITLSKLKGIQKIKFLSASGHVLATENGKLQFEKSKIAGETVTLSATETGDRHLDPITTSICKLDRVGYFRYFYVLAEYNQAFQLYLVAMKYDADGLKQYPSYRVFSKYDIYDLKYSEGDTLDIMLDNKMADKYSKIFQQYSSLQ